MMCDEQVMSCVLMETERERWTSLVIIDIVGFPLSLGRGQVTKEFRFDANRPTLHGVAHLHNSWSRHCGLVLSQAISYRL
jgi:hypothetical protein